ncbi:DUF3786 domain-containing protein [Metallumcola ferriviriculae]|uniref:DUF3786 domain-containing protein n=1 Tax=Metallumcola ferriviriculae TaxID=3039180 RepID=A0AAU0UM68_9FIRM|nr:DUF3786 domain-containing protein [Desulfitibacteraceae bacterium MK1]
MSQEVYGNYEGGYRQAVELLAAGDPKLMAECSGTGFDEEKSRFSVNYCNRSYYVSFPQGEVTSPAEYVNNADKQILAYYLARASGLPLRNKWLSFMQLPGGPHHYALFKQEAIDPLAVKFGRHMGIFKSIAEGMGGTPIKSGDAGYSIPVLPKIPLGVVIWAGDEDFSASANIVFDDSAATYLSTDTLYLLGIQLSLKIRWRLQEF